MNKILLLLVFIPLIIFIFYSITPTITSSSSTATVTSSSSSKYFDPNRTVYIISAISWCYWCKVFAPEFKKASESTDAKIIYTTDKDSDTTLYYSLIKKFGLNYGYPTVVRADRKFLNLFDGLKAQDIIDFANS